MVDMNIRIKELRQQKHITQLQLAERLGVTKSMVSAYETGARYPSYEILIKIARVFGVSTDYLLGVAVTKSIDISGLTEHQTELVSGLIAEFKKTK